MSITDTTASIDTAWAEYPTVTFLAGTLADIDAMVTEIESKLKRGTLSTSTSPTLVSVQRWCVRAKEELMQVKSYTFGRRFAYATLSAGDYRISLPPDYNGGDVSVKDTTNNRKLKIWPSNKFDLKFPDVDEESNDEPVICCIKNMELWLAPPVSGTPIIELEYDRSGSDNTTTDYTYLPEIERFYCCDYAIYEACESLEDWTKAKWYKEKWLFGLGLSRKADAKRRWKEKGFRAISTFEEFSARGNQN